MMLPLSITNILIEGRDLLTRWGEVMHLYKPQEHASEDDAKMKIRLQLPPRPNIAVSSLLATEQGFSV